MCEPTGYMSVTSMQTRWSVVFAVLLAVLCIAFLAGCDTRSESTPASSEPRTGPFGRHDAFARCLAEHGAIMYGAFWCEHCREQKEMFEGSFELVHYVECAVPGSRNQTLVCSTVGIKHYPTWVFPSAEIHEGVLSLQELSQKTGCPLQ